MWGSVDGSTLNHISDDEEVALLSCDEGCAKHGAYVEISFTVETVLAEPDTAAMSVWVNAEWFDSNRYHVEKDER